MIKHKGKYSHLSDTEYLFCNPRSKYDELLYPDAMKAKYEDASALSEIYYLMPDKDDDDRQREFHVNRAKEWAEHRVKED